MYTPKISPHTLKTPQTPLLTLSESFSKLLQGMESTAGDKNLDRRFTQFRVPTWENHGRHLYHYPPENFTSSPQNPCFAETDLDPTLEAALSRLDLSAYPHHSPYFSTSLGGDMGNESVVGNSEYDFTIGGGEGLSQLSMLEIEQSSAELRRLGVFNNGFSSTHGYVGIEDYGHYPIAMGSSDIEGQYSFQSGSYPAPVFRKPYINHNGLLPDNGERSKYWNQSYLGFPGQFLGGGVGEKPPIMHHSNRNGLLCDSTRMVCSGVRGESVLNNVNGSKSCLYDRRIERQWDQISLEDLRGRIVALAMDQYGCRFLQTKFEGIKEEEIKIIFVEVIEHMVELMLDQFGNYLIQRLVEVCNEKQRTQILLSVTKTKFQLVFICLNMHGTRSVQKLLEYLTTPQQVSLLMSALIPGAVALMNDINGHHVIQHCLKRFSDEDNKHLLKVVVDNCLVIATDKSGCCVLKTCVDYSQGEPKERLVAEIIANALPITKDRYGNYVVQHLLELKIARVTANLLSRLEGNYFSLSCNKYGSNVVEKCLIESGEEQSRKIIMELLRSPNVSMLLLDPFGNYVIQSALTVSKGLVHNALVKLVETHSSSIRRNPYGKKVLTWFDKKKLCNKNINVQK